MHIVAYNDFIEVDSKKYLYSLFCSRFITLERTDFLMNENNIDMNKLLAMLSKMDKKQLESGLKQVQDIINKNNNKQ